jgi:hypothetical protein
MNPDYEINLTLGADYASGFLRLSICEGQNQRRKPFAMTSQREFPQDHPMTASKRPVCEMTKAIPPICRVCIG